MGDPYFYRMAFSPVAVVKLSDPATFDECLSDWVQPFHRLISLASGRPERLTYLALGIAGETSDGHTRRCQVYGSGIHQAPYASRNDDVVRAHPAFRVKPDAIPLLELLREWRKLEVDQHPFMETYGSTIVIPELHPRSRYLLLIQALEGLFGHQTQAQFKERKERHEQKRATVLAAVRLSLYREAQRFLKDHLMRTPPTSLDACLREMFASLPTDPTAELNHLDLVTLVRQDPRRPQDVANVLRLVRNDLSHGNKSYAFSQVHEVAQVLNRVARAHLLRLLGCGDQILLAALTPDR